MNRIICTSLGVLAVAIMAAAVLATPTPDNHAVAKVTPVRSTPHALVFSASQAEIETFKAESGLTVTEDAESLRGTVFGTVVKLHRDGDLAALKRWLMDHPQVHATHAPGPITRVGI